MAENSNRPFALLSRWWRGWRDRRLLLIQADRDQLSPDPGSRDHMKEMIALGVAMAEAEAIWRLREKARRWVAATQATPLLHERGDAAAQITAELNALRDMRSVAADKIEQLVRQSAREAEAERWTLGVDTERSSDQADTALGEEVSARSHRKNPQLR